MGEQTIRSMLARVRELLHRRRINRELDEEMQLHLDMEIEHNIARGMSPIEARRAATIAFGGVQRFREEAGEARGIATIEHLAREARFAARRLRRTPAFAAGVIATLAIGLGATAGIGTLIYDVVLAPLPYSNPDRLVDVSVLTSGLGITTTESSDGTFLYFAERARSFSAIAAYHETDAVAITEGDAPERVTSAMVSPNVFALLGTRPALGRLFNDADGMADTVPVMISYGLWQRRFGGDSSVAGKSIELNRGPRRIVGVLPRGFDFPSPNASIYYASTVRASRADLANRYMHVVARLERGVTAASAQAELNTLVASIHGRFPELTANAVQASGLRAEVRPLRDAIAAPVRAELTLLGLMVVVVLLIATANVATLFLLRAHRLRGEVAVARALGASRAVIVQRFVVEATLLSLTGALVTMPVLSLSLTAKLGFPAAQIPRLHEVAMTWRVVGAVFALALVIGIALGFLAAARIGDRPAIEAIRAESRSTAGRAWRRAQQGLVATQMALALSLLLAAALTGESLLRLRRVNIGFTPANGSTFSAVLPFSGYSLYGQTADFHFRVMERLRALPGVTDVAAAMHLPLIHDMATIQRLVAGSLELTADANVVTPNYFSVMGIPLRSGRTFARNDLVSSNPAVIISASLAHELFPGLDPIGREIRIANTRTYPPYRVIGVAGDVHGARVADGVIKVLYFPFLQDLPPTAKERAPIPYNPSANYIVRSSASSSSLAPSFRAAVASIDRRVPLTRITTLDAVVADATAKARLTMVLLAMAAAATLVLGAIGLYSVIAYAVAGRTPEFAVRLALGATAPTIVALVFGEWILVTVAGSAAGVALSLAGSRFIRGLLYEVSATNPVSYTAAAALLLLTAAVAMYVPARRAGRTDPAGVLR